MSAQLDELKPFRVAEAYCYDAGAPNAAKNLRAAVAALIAERDALREALGGVMDRLVDRHESDEAAVIARRALTTGESA